MILAQVSTSCGVCQDRSIHQGQEREIHIQEPRPENSCNLEAILSTRGTRTTTDAEKEEQ